MKKTTRRDFLKKSAGALALCAFPNIILANGATKKLEKKVTLYNIHTGELAKATYWADGRYIAEEIESLNRLLRDFRTGETHAMDLALFDLLYDLSCRFDHCRKPFHVISGYRSAKTNETLRRRTNGVAKRSLHMQGKAIDINLPGAHLNDLRLAARHLKRGGVGYYPKSGFIHVDTGRVRYW
ncbi:YcbK family protein [Hydrogenimonas cancrithermarum]|uniref:Murein endopeptidase K n=1 Tax=Hydrogenimonas cancrithermarum TaxID=2993563 RepID=A0ABN6WS93_9BACT|nr:YcbK family protein [Hydrogenimonas cancrithermarum]BDY11863.1 twin-arginine translocation pathway signal protein [Hydrogenimonas cancrithermarum]